MVNGNSFKWLNEFLGAGGESEVTDFQVDRDRAERWQQVLHVYMCKKHESIPLVTSKKDLDYNIIKYLCL